MVRLFLAGAAAASLVAAPAMAARSAPTTAPAASKLSLSSVPRAGKAGGRSEKLDGNGALIAGILAVGVVAGGIIAITNDGDSDSN